MKNQQPAASQAAANVALGNKKKTCAVVQPEQLVRVTRWELCLRRI